MRISQYLAIVVLILAVVSVAIGGTFIYQAVDKEAWIKEAMRAEKVTLGLSEAEVKAGNVIDMAEEAQAAADTIKGHRRGIASSYEELLGGESTTPLIPNTSVTHRL